MKTFWKILGLGALAAGLTPYKVEKNEETGESSYQALLWRINIGPGSEENRKKIDMDFGINLGEGTLTSKLTEKMMKKEEAHLFSDELSVEYNAAEDAEEEASVDEATLAAVENTAAEEETAVEEAAAEAEESKTE